MIKFYIIIGIELLFSPFLYLWEEIKKEVSRYQSDSPFYKKNIKEIDNEVVFAVHEWAGYPFIRKKTIKKVNRTFTCGLKFHFDRLATYQGKYIIKKILTISDCNDKYIEDLRNAAFFDKDFQIYPVKNLGMDLSGYSYVTENLINMDTEKIVFLTNSSVDSAILPFIDDYVEIFKTDPELGLLGISYSTKVYQTVIKNNFRPHVQSFFLVSRSSILKELIDANGYSFPGAKESYKLSLIRFGEVKITEMIQTLGYKVGVITEDNKLHILPNFGTFYNGFAKWKLPFDDYRLHALHPNRINRFENK